MLPKMAGACGSENDRGSKAGKMVAVLMLYTGWMLAMSALVVKVGCELKMVVFCYWNERICDRLIVSRIWLGGRKGVCELSLSR